MSMEIVDFKQKGRKVSRTTIANVTAKNFIKGRPNDRIGIVAFAGRPFLASPITLQHDWLLYSLDNDVRPSQKITQGTAVGSALAASGARLEGRETKSKIVVLITDGSSNSGQLTPVEAARLLADKNIRVYTVAIGTKDGRLSRSIQSSPRVEFDTTSLKKIAELTGGEYFRASSTEMLEESFKTIDDLEKTDIKRKVHVTTIEYHYLFSMLAFFSLLATLLLHTLRPNPSPA